MTFSYAALTRLLPHGAVTRCDARAAPGEAADVAGISALALIGLEMRALLPSNELLPASRQMPPRHRIRKLHMLLF